MALERELATFQQERTRLLAEHPGKFALIHGEAVDSVWDTAEDALDAGYARFGLEPFLVQEIVEVERPRYFSRRVTRCP
jgi:hypothetical protein